MTRNRSFATLGTILLGGLLACTTEGSDAASRPQTLTAYELRSSLPSCDASRSQEVAYIVPEERMVVCYDGSWRDVAAPAAGPAGVDGVPGSAGARGPVGPAGPSGANGVIGANGANGVIGPRGPAGAPGDAGGPGAAGIDSLVRIVGEPAGWNCSNGGLKVQAGPDTNRDGALGDDEVTQTGYVCNVPCAADLTSDVTNCGFCGNTCGGAEICEASACIVPVCPSAGLACSTAVGTACDAPSCGLTCAGGFSETTTCQDCNAPPTAAGAFCQAEQGNQCCGGNPSCFVGVAPDNSTLACLSGGTCRPPSDPCITDADCGGSLICLKGSASCGCTGPTPTYCGTPCN